MSTLKVDTIQGKSAATDLDLSNVTNLKMPAGHVVQFVNGRVSDDRDATTSTSFVQLGDTLSITPKFSSSKIFLIAVVSLEMAGGGHTAYMDFGRTTGGTTTKPLSGFSSGISTVYQESWNTKTYTFLDSPSTTSAVAYFCAFKVSAGTVYINDNSANNMTNFTLMEIAQ